MPARSLSVPQERGVLDSPRPTMAKLAQSYVHGTSAIPLLGETVGARFDATARAQPEREALVVRHQNVRWTWRRLGEEVDRLAAGLVALGLKPGELLTRGYCVMPYYWNDPERTKKAIDPARWIASGDLATLDAEGYCRIVGRTKDMLIRGGENIYPREIEEFLYTNPKIEQVEVIGVPDPKFGEEVSAWIRLKPGARATAEEIRAFCKDRIAYFKIPRYIRFVESFPMTVTSKVQKFVMRKDHGRGAGRGAGGEEGGMTRPGACLRIRTARSGGGASR